MFAGVPGMGAVDAWHQALTTIEELKLEGKAYCGGVADIAKFFDQIRRRLVYQLAAAAGIPPPILTACQAYIDNLCVYNALAGGVGTQHKRLCGLPQGCPFPMVMVALIVRPWIILMRTVIGVQCYILAAVVLILATGRRMIGSFAEALDKTHMYLKAMGAKVAPTKSYNFASNGRGAIWLGDTKRKDIDAKIEVVKDFRYLGAHLTTRQTITSSTLEKRWEQATLQLRRLRYCPAIVEAKA